MGQICLECLISGRWSTVRLQSMMFSATFAREAPEKQRNQFPYLIATSHCGFGNAFLHISSHFFTFFTFFTYADLGTLGTRQGGPDLGTSGPRDLGTSSGWSQHLGRPRRPGPRRPACLSSWRRAVTKTRCAFGVASLVAAVSSEA